MCFSDFVPNSEDRDEIGKAFIGLVIFYVSVHFFFLFIDMCKGIRDSIKKWYRKRIIAKINQKKGDDTVEVVAKKYQPSPTD